MRILLPTVPHMAQTCVRLPVSMNGWIPTAESFVDFAVSVILYSSKGTI